ncbi:hypothetical protein L1987_37259 [Smallanthus sonchifolius]|uniref:Uncharacterized protein n=1 Tax=Smallanthus sonchifolius TaxID=185202 RepID=A0ACB9HH48_9ASTR|nr:hypothetical protein L1987_37259 [Smallanthus sonchifolius]
MLRRILLFLFAWGHLEGTAIYIQRESEKGIEQGFVTFSFDFPLFHLLLLYASSLRFLFRPAIHSFLRSCLWLPLHLSVASSSTSCSVRWRSSCSEQPGMLSS